MSDSHPLTPFTVSSPVDQVDFDNGDAEALETPTASLGTVEGAVQLRTCPCQFCPGFNPLFVFTVFTPQTWREDGVMTCQELLRRAML